MPPSPRRSLWKILGPQVLGALSLAVGLALIGQCAAHTARAVLAAGPKPDLALRCFKAAFFTPFQHSVPYQILLGSGIALSLLGIALMRVWAMAFFAAAAACFAAYGGMVAERLVVPRGAEALLLQHGCSGLWEIFTEAPEGTSRDPLMILWIGFAALIPGLYLAHLHKKAAPAGDRGPAPRRPAGRAEGSASFPVTPPSPTEAGADTVADLDLSPDLETSEVHAPAEDLPPLEEPLPEEPPALETPASGTEPEAPPPEDAPAELPPVEPEAPPPAVEETPEPREETPEPEPVAEPPPGKPLAACALALGLMSAVPAALLRFSPSTLPEPWAARALGAGLGAGLGAAAMLILSGRMGAMGWAAAAAAAAGLAGAGILLGMGG